MAGVRRELEVGASEREAIINPPSILRRPAGGCHGRWGLPKFEALTPVSISAPAEN
jgi:hypothetical protein